MEVKAAEFNDLPEMISLLKKSLGEGLIPKSEAYFKWKHELNPFGKSKILIAKEDGKIVGLRAFMKWKWKDGNETITAVRAVDTATDPAFQGKGIFKKLTLQAVEECKAEGCGLVFNSPNENSRPGYLKMGWEDEGRMPLLIKVGSLIPSFYSEEKAEEIYFQFSVKREFEKLNDNYIFPESNKQIYTPLSTDYLKWRFEDCPIVNYGAIIENDFGIVFRLKRINKFVELRICEIWEKDSGANKKLKKALRKIIGAANPIMVSCAPSPLITGKIGFFGPFLKGPITTTRPLAITSLEKFKNFKSWQPSIGSMELF
ncbi:MAG: GNAT family N-acetyltransferase [Ferruginibacter sp.]